MNFDRARTTSTGMKDGSVVKKSIPQLNMADKEKINYLSGSLIDEFVENVQAMKSGDTDTIYLLEKVLSTLYGQEQVDEMYNVLQLLYGIIGLQFPTDLKQIERQPEKKKYFMFSFLLDLDDVMSDYISE